MMAMFSVAKNKEIVILSLKICYLNNILTHKILFQQKFRIFQTNTSMFSEQSMINILDI